MLDVVVKPEVDIAPTSDTPSRVRLGRGGSGANMAEALAREGHRVTYVGACGGRPRGATFRRRASRRGRQRGARTRWHVHGVVVAVVDVDGQRAMLTDRGANSTLGLDHVLAQLESPFDHLHVSGYTLLDSSTTDVGQRALARASEHGYSTSVDVCSVAPLLVMTPDSFLQASSGARMLFANEEEALALSGSADVDAAMTYLSERFDEVVITRGEHGARARRGDDDYATASTSGVVVDTTGAGDAATGAYLAARLHGDEPGIALERAMVAASSVVGGLGALG